MEWSVYYVLFVIFYLFPVSCFLFSVCYLLFALYWRLVHYLHVHSWTLDVACARVWVDVLYSTCTRQSKHISTRDDQVCMYLRRTRRKRTTRRAILEGEYHYLTPHWPVIEISTEYFSFRAKLLQYLLFCFRIPHPASFPLSSLPVPHYSSSLNSAFFSFYKFCSWR